jgi:hypothetical protein
VEGILSSIQNREEFAAMTDLKGIRKFEYRPCRIATGFNVDFEVEGETLYGLCRDVSDTGIRIKLEGSVVVGDSGTLTLRHPLGVLKLEASVAYIDQYHVGLVFVFETNRERANALDYMSVVANHAAAAMVIQFP